MSVESAEIEQERHWATVCSGAFAAHLKWQECSHTEADAFENFGALESEMRDPEVADALMKLARRAARAIGSDKADEAS